MSDPAAARLGGGDPETGDVDGIDEAYDDREPPTFLRTIKRLRAIIVLVPLVAVVLVAASIGANKLWADIPESTVSGPEVTCWDGRTATVVECGEPRGNRGLRWVFPSYRINDDRCDRVADAPPFDVACTTRFDQRSVTITYAVRPDAAALLKAVRKAYGNRPVSAAGGERILFRDNRRGDDGLFRTTVVYAEHPFAVTVEAPERDVRDNALAELVRFRPADEVVVRG